MRLCVGHFHSNAKLAVEAGMPCNTAALIEQKEMQFLMRVAFRPRPKLPKKAQLGTQSSAKSIFEFVVFHSPGSCRYPSPVHVVREDRPMRWLRALWNQNLDVPCAVIRSHKVDLYIVDDGLRCLKNRIEQTSAEAGAIRQGLQ